MVIYLHFITNHHSWTSKISCNKLFLHLSRVILNHQPIESLKIVNVCFLIRDYWIVKRKSEHNQIHVFGCITCVTMVLMSIVVSFLTFKTHGSSTCLHRASISSSFHLCHALSLLYYVDLYVSTYSNCHKIRIIDQEHRKG